MGDSALYIDAMTGAMTGAMPRSHIPDFAGAQSGLLAHPAFSFLALLKSALIRVCQPVPVLR